MAPVKRSKTDVSNAKRLKPEPMLKGVTTAIDLSSLPVDVKRMFQKLAPLSFATPAAERHDFQAKVVDMVGEIVVQLQTTMRQDIDAKDEAATERSLARDELLSVVSRAEASKAEKESASEALASSSAEVAKSLEDKEAELRHAQEEQRVGDAKHAADVTAAESFAQSLGSHLRPILNGHGAKKELELNLKTLMPLIRPLKLDSSLSCALKTSYTKPLAERSSFDTLVVQELESALQRHLEHLQGIVTSGTAGLASCAATVDAICKDRDTLDEQHQAAHTASVMSSKIAEEAREKLASAQDAVTVFDAEHADAERALAEKKAEYENFVVWNVECYNMLKDKVSGRPVETVTAAVSKISEAAPEVPVISSDAVCA
jgi:hypothetical protein